MSSITAQRLTSAEVYADATVGLECESQLRIAAAMLNHPDEITATTVVGELRLDQCAQFDRLVADLADEYELEATMRVEDGRFSVRFVRPKELVEPVQTSRPAAWLRRLVLGLAAARP